MCQEEGKHVQARLAGWGNSVSMTALFYLEISTAGQAFSEHFIYVNLIPAIRPGTLTIPVVKGNQGTEELESGLQ